MEMMMSLDMHLKDTSKIEGDGHNLSCFSRL